MYLRAALLCALVLTACSVGPNFHRPAAPQVERYTPEPLPEQIPASPLDGVETQRFVRELDLPARWWQLFHSEKLDSLIEDAIANNADLKAAQAAVRVA